MGTVNGYSFDWDWEDEQDPMFYNYDNEQVSPWEMRRLADLGIHNLSNSEMEKLDYLRSPCKIGDKWVVILESTDGQFVYDTEEEANYMYEAIDTILSR